MATEEKSNVFPYVPCIGINSIPIPFFKKNPLWFLLNAAGKLGKTQENLLWHSDAACGNPLAFWNLYITWHLYTHFGTDPCI